MNLPLVKSVVVDSVEDIAFAGVSKDRLLTERFPLKLHRTSGIGSIRKFTFNVRDKNRRTNGEVGRLEEKTVRLQRGGQVLGKGVRERGSFALVFYLRVIIVRRTFATTYGSAALKRKFALGLGGKIKHIYGIELILKSKGERGQLVCKEKRKSPCASVESNGQEFAFGALGK